MWMQSLGWFRQQDSGKAQVAGNKRVLMRGVLALAPCSLPPLSHVALPSNLCIAKAHQTGLKLACSWWQGNLYIASMNSGITKGRGDKGKHSPQPLLVHGNPGQGANMSSEPVINAMLKSQKVMVAINVHRCGHF